MIKWLSGNNVSLREHQNSDTRIRNYETQTETRDRDQRQIETNMAPASFWRVKRCCAAERSQRRSSGTLNRSRSRYIGYKRRLVRLYHHKHFRWRAFIV